MRIRVEFDVCFLHSHTEANYVEEHLLTFLSIKYFGIRPLQK